jgi:5-methylthioadenosine/S-adenosylhomocysteine deaminase
VLVLARRHDDPWESVLVSSPADVELVTLGGDLAYGRPDWVTTLAGSTDGTEPVIAWGKQMLVDTRYSVRATNTRAPKLAELRAELIARYPQVGPIFG